MKKYYYLYILAIFAIIFTLPTATRAESGSSLDDSDDDSPIETEVETEIETNTSPTTRPTTPRPTNLELLRAKNAEVQKINAEAAKRLQEKARLSSTTRPLIKDMRVETRQEIKDGRIETRVENRQELKDGRIESRVETRAQLKNASSSVERREIRKDGQEERKELRKDQFEIRKNTMVRQLNLALNNLKQIRERINSRIEKATSNGKDMSKAKELLLIADAKIITAENAIKALNSYIPTPVATTTDAAAAAAIAVDLIKPREFGSAAISAVKDAHKALVEVVRAVAQALGEGNATTTNTTI